jgi:BASS family bile acid:Na+ symporter
LITVLSPLAAGIAARHLAPSLAERIAKPINLIATIVLLAGAVLIVVSAWPVISSLVGNGTVLVFAAFVLFGLMIGHVLGGPEPEDRTVLALSTASRHPGIALAVAGANYPGQKLVLAAVALYLIVNVIVSIPYLNWRKRQAGIGGVVKA